MRAARSFRPRRRGLPAARAAEYERAAAEYVVPSQGGAIDLREMFPSHDDVVLDIGFGGGESLVELAAQRPSEAVIGVEVHTPGVARVVAAAEANGWRHVRVVATDVLEVLPRLALGSLAAIRVWFPDPWLKQRQRHRRLVRADVLPALVDRLRPGGVLHVATDIHDYAEQVQRVTGDEPRLRGGVVPRPEWRPYTRFERRGLDAGRVATDLWYVRVDDANGDVDDASGGLRSDR